MKNMKTRINKNEPDPRYDAHRVAEKLVEICGATLLMGSSNTIDTALSFCRQRVIINY